MAEEEKKTRVAAIGDIHVKVSDKGKWSDFFRDAAKHAEVLIIAGDLTDTGDEVEAQILAAELKVCTIPVITVLGNHDHEKGRQKLIRQTIQNEMVHVLDGESVVVGDVGFAGIKGFGGGFDENMLSMFGEEAMKNFVKESVDEALHLERALSRLDQEYEHLKKIVVMHYSPIKATVCGEPPAVFPFLGCSRLAEPITKRQVLAVFHGHAHRGTLEGEIVGGTKVYNVARPILQKTGYPLPYYILEV